MQGFLPCLLVFFMTVLPLQVQSAEQALSIEGQYQTIDDKTGQKKALLAVMVHDGELQGRIVKVNWQAGDHHRCVHCEGALKNKPIEGMRILWGLQQTSKLKWIGGYILDPHNGRVYRAEIKQQGKTLWVRAYLGTALFGRTQQWHKVNEEGV